MSIVYVATHETDSEGGYVVGVCGTLEGAMKAADTHRAAGVPRLEWVKLTERCWLARAGTSGTIWSYQIEEWAVDPGYGTVSSVMPDGSVLKGFVYPSPLG